MEANIFLNGLRPHRQMEIDPYGELHRRNDTSILLGKLNGENMKTMTALEWYQTEHVNNKDGYRKTGTMVHTLANFAQWNV